MYDYLSEVTVHRKKHLIEQVFLDCFPPVVIHEILLVRICSSNIIVTYTVLYEAIDVFIRLFLRRPHTYYISVYCCNYEPLVKLLACALCYISVLT